MSLRTTAFEAAELLGWSVDDLARRSGIARSTLYAIKNGERQPGPKTIAGLMRALPHLPFERLFVPSESTQSDKQSDIAISLRRLDRVAAASTAEAAVLTGDALVISA